jgi:flagellin-like protein
MEQNELGVSPVIGVILMVAITVILAAVIAAFVFGMVGDVRGTKIVAVTMQQADAKNITLINYGGQDVGGLTSISVTGDLKTLPASLGITVGAKGSYETSAGIGKKYITVIGVFSDGTEQVLLDTSVSRTVA